MSTAATSDDSPRMLYELRMPLRWGDHDALNHVNNAAYLVYLQEARVRWLAKHVPNWDHGDSAPIMAAIHANYRRPMKWPADILVQLFCERLGTSSLTIAHRIVDANDPSILYLDGNVVMVWIDPATGKSVALPEAIRKACA
jgi:acyl-CoA thioester hydrolase